MVDKLKNYFQSKKTNVKFINAGKGCRLSDSSTSNSRTPEVRQPIVRAEPTLEAKVAGQAALARIEAKKPNTAKFNTSYQAIQARVKRELEEERKAQLQAQKNAEKENAKKEKKDTSILAVTDVYYRCPLSDEILSKEEWQQKIREYLYEQLETDEMGLTACLIIKNCNRGKQKIDTCVETLGKYLDNIINNPDIEKYRKIRMSNKIFQEKVLPMEGAMHFLQAAGFRQTKLMHNDAEEDFLVWDPENCDIENITILVETLRFAETIPLELDRNLQVLLPLQAVKRNELPASFFTITPAEIKQEQQLRTEAVERNQMLRTKAMREREHERDLQKYKFSLIRIKFPDDIILQGTFGVHEKFQAVIDFVTENLTNSTRPFTLKELPHRSFTNDCFDKTLIELKLVPAVVVSFFWENKQDKDESEGYLKEDILQYIQPA